MEKLEFKAETEMTSIIQHSLESGAGMKEIIDLRPMELRLTRRAFFRLFEEIRNNKGNPMLMKTAFAHLAEFCAKNMLAQTYSDYDSFKRCYYKQINAQRRAS